MALESDVIRSVYVNLGLPPQRVLPLTVVLPKIHEQLKFRGVQSKLSDQNYKLAVSPPFIPDGRDIAVPNGWAFERGAEAIVEVLVDETSDVWDAIEIVNKADLDVYEQSGRLAVAFYGHNPARMAFSWDPALAGHQLRVSYDETQADPATIDTKIFLPDGFAPLVGVCVALECIPDLIEAGWKDADALDRRAAMLLAKKAEWQEEWKFERFSSAQQGATQRLPFNRNRPGWRSHFRR